MNHVKKIIVLTLVLAVGAVAAFAQNGPNRRPPPPADRIEEIKTRLDRIEKSYIAQLGFRERREAIGLMNQVIALLGEVDWAERPAVPPPPPAVLEKDFSVFVKMVKGANGFADNSKYLIARYAVNHWFTVEQCRAILQLYSFDNDRLEVAEIVLPKIVDPGRLYLVLESFTFSDAKEKFKKMHETAGMP